jgi:hypothetical protein
MRKPFFWAMLSMFFHSCFFAVPFFFWQKHKWKYILNIAQKNGFHINIIHDIKKKEITKQKNIQITTEEKQIKHKQNKKRITFTYHSSLVRRVTNLFKNTDINIAFKANNTIYQHLAQKADNRNPSGIYEIKCNTCSKNYVGQSGRPITIRHRERIRHIKTNNPPSAYATHILNNRNEYGTANDTLKLIQP